MSNGIATLTFTSADHRAEFVKWFESREQVYGKKIDPEYAAAIYILTSQETLWTQTEQHINKWGMDFKSMLQKGAFSSGERALVQLAGNLFNGRTTAVPVEVCCDLDEENYRLAKTAMDIRRYGVTINGSRVELRER